MASAIKENAKRYDFKMWGSTIFRIPAANTSPNI